jgi:hypothetical protein
MIQYSDYTRYFRNLAQKHKQIRHSSDNQRFFRATLEEALSAISNRKIKYPAMMLLPLQIRSQGETDNEYEKIYGGFMILDALRNVNDFDRIEAILNETRVIAEDVMQKIYHDIDECNTPASQKLFQEFNRNEITKKEWGPVWDNAYGWSYEFPLSSFYNYQYDTAKWQ